MGRWRWPWQRPRDPDVTNQAVTVVGDPLLAVMLGLSTDSPAVISEQTAMSLSSVFRAVSLVAGSLGSLPLRSLQTNRDGTRQRTGSFLDNPGLEAQTPFEWKELAGVHLLLHGNAYAQHIYNGAGSIAGLNLIHPLAVGVERDYERPGGRKYTVRLPDGDVHVFDVRTMTHIPGLSLDGLKGVSPITLARLSIGTALAGDRASHRTFTNGAMAAGLVTPEEDLEEDEAKVIKKTVNQAVTGVENAGQIAVINRKLKFQQWQLSPEDAQFLQSRSFQVEEIGRWYGVPPHLLGLTEKSTSWGQGIQEQNRGLARYTLQPWTTRIEQRLSRLLRGSLTCEFDYAQFIAPAPEDEIGLLIEQVNNGLLTLNEARRIRNLPSLPAETGADLPRVPPGAAPAAAPAPANTEPEEAAA